MAGGFPHYTVGRRMQIVRLRPSCRVARAREGQGSSFYTLGRKKPFQGHGTATRKLRTFLKFWHIADKNDKRK